MILNRPAAFAAQQFQAVAGGNRAYLPGKGGQIRVNIAGCTGQILAIDQRWIPVQ
jgi:hypothetical protein